MAIISGGNLMLSDTSPTFARSTYFPPTGVSLTGQFATYAAIYRKQVWVNVVVDKLAQNVARLPLKVYERQDEGDRLEARDTPFARLLRNPNPKMDPFFFMQWTGATFFVYGEALWIKVRGADGQPTELWPLHPVNTKTTEDPDTGGLLYAFYSGVNATVPVMAIPAADIVHFKNYNPDTTQRGLSKLEPLRQTLVNEDAARRATASFWARGARPAAALTYPGKLSDEAKVRLKRRFEQVASGVDNTGSTVVLEEGMDAKIIGLNQEEAQYIETRKLNREEVCAAYDIPPPAVHILDHATYCLPAGTLVATERGPIPIVDVHAGDRVWSVRDGAVRSARVMWAGQTGFKPLLTIKTQNRTLRCTANHPLWVRRTTREAPGGRRAIPGRRGPTYRKELVWVEAGDLKVGDIVVTLVELPEHGSDESPTRTVSEGFAEFCGLLLGDGWLSPHGVTIARARTAQYMDHYRDVMRAEFRQRDGAITLGEEDRATRFASVSAARELAALGLSGTAHTKTVPSWVHSLSPKLRAAFIRGFLDADGSVDKKGRMSFASCNETMLRQIRELCIGLGVPVTNIRCQRGMAKLPNGRMVSSALWTFTCSNPGANRTIGSHDPRYQERLAIGVPFGQGKLSTYYTYPIRKGCPSIAPPEGCGYAKIVSITPDQEAVPVYDLEIDGSHNFVAEGVVVHNSNITEQLRSVYRDTMAAKLGLFESTIDSELRPDFDPDGTLYAEFLLDEVLRGDFETRAGAVAQKIATAQITPNEARKLDNLPAVEGGDRLYINAAYIPIDEVSSRTSPNPPAEDVPGDRPATPGEAVSAPAVAGPKMFDRRVAAKVAWRASRAASLSDIDPAVLTAELNGEAVLVRTLLAESKAAGDDIPTFCALVWALAGR